MRLALWVATLTAVALALYTVARERSAPRVLAEGGGSVARYYGGGDWSRP